MSITVRLGPNAISKRMLLGTVEIDGVDISERVTGLSISASPDAIPELTLKLFLYGEDVVDIEMPEDSDPTVVATVLTPDGLVDVTAIGDRARRYVNAIAGPQTGRGVS